MKNLIIWGIVLFIAIMISIFIHEIGHGISYYLQGISVSTGFNRVGDIYKTPSDPEFRTEFNKQRIKWDLGVPFTLILAIICTILLYKVGNKYAVVILAAFAMSNSLLRLLPMINSFIGLLNRGQLTIEDEVSMGSTWYNLTGILMLKFLPIIISVVISVICYYFTIKGIRNNVSFIKCSTSGFTISSIIAVIISIKIANILDEVIRINWG